MTRSLTIDVTGSSGLVGSSLMPCLENAGHRAVRPARPGAGSGLAP
ncbi:MAG: hypothetical protein KKE86_08450 [Planctomycetes bacterium]|nr:hypothetical protein [Planctomycetota bacterium]MBU4399350.1 hypothetical protein [Planctomycetota bacterium]MCG2684896.1 hypothetical protein [Planctomycetales bacterium]